MKMLIVISFIIFNAQQQQYQLSFAKKSAIDYIEFTKKDRSGIFDSCDADLSLHNSHESRSIEIKVKFCGGVYGRGKCSNIEKKTIEPLRYFTYGSKGCSGSPDSSAEIVGARFAEW